MSFSSTTKNELSRIVLTDDVSALAELAALVRMNGSIHISGYENIKLRFNTENAAIARRIFSILKLIYKTEIDVMVRKNTQLKKNNSYLIEVHNKEISRRVLADVGFSKEESGGVFDLNYKVPPSLVSTMIGRRSYIRGSFLGGGSISNPEKTYHIEFVTTNLEHATDLKNIINSFELNSKIILRKESYIVYIKESEQLVDLLNIIGAHQALLRLEDIRVLKDVRNNINRIVNCETANLEKTIKASFRQVQDIKLIKEKSGLEKLPKNLFEIAEVRLNYPDASLKEIGEMLSPPIGKSGVNHRFKKLEEIAEGLRGGIQ